MADILQTIVEQKKREVACLPARIAAVGDLRDALLERNETRDFAAALRQPRAGDVALIAEVKKASPSAGVICPDFDPVRIAREYEAAGASCLSVLTDEQFFQGSLDYLKQIRAAVKLPLLRKDFIIDERQILEAIEWGADAILLIVAILDDARLNRFHSLATEAGLAALVEVHDEEELDRALAIGAGLIGVNNRDLKTFNVDLGTTERLAARLLASPLTPRPSPLLIAESGIHTRNDVRRLKACGARAILVGESLMRGGNIQLKARELLGLELAESGSRSVERAQDRRILIRVGMARRAVHASCSGATRIGRFVQEQMFRPLHAGGDIARCPYRLSAHFQIGVYRHIDQSSGVSVRVKICGITNLDDALAAVDAGADALGFMFYEASPRNLSANIASDIVRQLPPFVAKVGVFANATAETVRRTIEACGLDTLQFHGDETPEFCQRFVAQKVYKAFRIRSLESLQPLPEYATDAWLLDSFVAGQIGGTGAVFNWDLAAEAKKLGRPVILAGGLTPENVAEAVRKVRPYAVDVSSGVESSPGRKDSARVRDFIAAAKSA